MHHTKEETMKVTNMNSPKTGRPVANQYIILHGAGKGAFGNYIDKQTFQSYDSIIAEITTWDNETRVILDKKYWDYSRTTLKYLGLFLGEFFNEKLLKKDIQKKIDDGEYRLEDLNK